MWPFRKRAAFSKSQPQRVPRVTPEPANPDVPNPRWQHYIYKGWPQRRANREP